MPDAVAHDCAMQAPNGAEMVRSSPNHTRKALTELKGGHRFVNLAFLVDDTIAAECASCRTPLTGPYCAQCGEKAIALRST